VTPEKKDVETVAERCGEIGLEDTVGMSARHTISAREKRPSARELPRISIDLQQTMPSSPGHERLSPAKVDRDLEVLGLLGEGGMGRVFLARQHSLDREVAIKTLRRSASDKERAALLSEGAITGHLEHPTIIPVHALGIDSEGEPVLVMKRVEGVEWSELVDKPDHPAWGDDPRDRLTAHLEILMQVCNAVEFAHEKQILHRDIKPQNVLIGRHGEVYLGDWGLAVRLDRDWEPQPLCGTPAYMAPEMVVGGVVDPRTDVYLLGATLHHLLTGAPRNGGSRPSEALLDAMRSAPFAYPPSVPEELAELCNRATACDPNDRPAGARELKQGIADYLAHRSAIALGRSAVERVGKLRRLVGEGALGDAAVQEEIDRLAVEARFGLTQARAEWRDNPAAVAAEAELESLLALRRARAAELERMARELDPSVGQRPRAIAATALTAVAVGLSVVSIVTGQAWLTPRILLVQACAPLGAFLLALVVFGRAVIKNAFNRSIAVTAAAIVGGIAVSRVFGVMGHASVPQILTNDCLIGAVATAVSGASILPAAWWCAGMLGAAAVGAALAPEHAMLAFSLGTGVGFTFSTWHLARLGAKPGSGRHKDTRHTKTD
jgi:eukaryotic-like serine/threonine-protein kinase